MNPLRCFVGRMSESRSALSQFGQRFKPTILMLIVLVITLLQVSFVRAQDPSDENAKIEKLEKEIKLLQKQIEKAEAEKKLSELTKPQVESTNQTQKQLEQETAIINAKASKAEAEKKLLTAYLPSSETKALEGKIDLGDKVTFEIEILAHKAMAEIAKNISDNIFSPSVEPKAETLVFYDSASMAAIQNYRSVKAQLDAMKSEYVSLTGGARALPLPLIPEAATSMFKSFADVVALFRTDVTIQGKDVNIEEVALISQLCRELKAKNRAVGLVYPTLYPPNLLSNNSPEILKALSDIYIEKALADEIVSRYEAQDQATQASSPDRTKIPKLKALNARFDKFVDGLLKAAENGGNPLASLINAERLISMLGNESSYVLYVRVLKAAGSNKTKKNLFTGSKLYHSGGSIISYMMFDREGAIKMANTLYNYDGYIQVKSKNDNLANNLQP